MKFKSGSRVLGVLLLTACASGAGRRPAQIPPASLCPALARIEIQAHRGSSALPENTLAAFRRAIEQGADAVEMDLQITKDDRIVVAHDPFVKTECSGARKIYYRDLTFDEVQTLKCDKERAPAFAEVLDGLKNLRTKRREPARLNIEIKYNPAEPRFWPSRKSYVGKILGVIREASLPQSQFMIQSFDIGILTEVHEQGPSVEIAPLLSDAEGGVRIAQSLGAKVVTPHYGQVSVDVISRFHAAGIKVIPWTVNDPETAERMIALGADGLISDRAEWLAFARSTCAQ